MNELLALGYDHFDELYKVIRWDRRFGGGDHNRCDQIVPVYDSETNAFKGYAVLTASGHLLSDAVG